jgi:hypothetical protein
MALASRIRVLLLTTFRSKDMLERQASRRLYLQTICGNVGMVDYPKPESARTATSWRDRRGLLALERQLRVRVICIRGGSGSGESAREQLDAGDQ